MPSVLRSERFWARTLARYSGFVEKSHALFIAERLNDLLAALNVTLLSTIRRSGRLANGV